MVSEHTDGLLHVDWFSIHSINIYEMEHILILPQSYNIRDFKFFLLFDHSSY